MTTLRSAAGTYAAFDAPRPHCRSKRRDDHKRGGPAPTPSAKRPTPSRSQLANAGPRPAGSPAERRAHQEVAARFRAAGLRAGFERFAVPGKGTSRDVIGIRDTPARCLVIAMAHADTVPPAPGADDNASGVGTLVALAPALATDRRRSATPGSSRPAPRSGPTPNSPTTSGRSALVDGSGARTGSPTSASRSPSTRWAAARASSCALRCRPAGDRGDADPEAARAAQRRRDLAPRQRDRQLRPPRARARRACRRRSSASPTSRCATPRRTRRTASQRGAFARVLRVVWPLLREVS